MSSIVVTGGAGYVGCHIAFLLSNLGYNVIVLDSFVHQQKFNPSWATIIKADYGDKAVLEDVFANNAVEAVMHCASFIEVGRSVKEPLEFYENNVGKTIGLLQVMQKYAVKKIIFSSSCAVYGQPQWIPLTEDHPKNPISPYGNTKVMIEEMFKDAAQAYGLQYVCLRYFNAAGATPEAQLGEQHDPESHLIPLLLRAAMDKKPFYVFGNDYPTADGTAIRDFLHVKDIAQAHLKALQYLNTGGVSTCLNLGTGNGYSVKQMIAAVERVCGLPIDVVWAGRRIGDPPVLVANFCSAEKILGWKPQYSDIEEIIASAYVFMKQ